EGPAILSSGKPISHGSLKQTNSRREVLNAMLSRKNKFLLLKLASLFSVVRGYNIAVVVLAQYLTSIYIFAPNKPVHSVLFDTQLLWIVLASALSIASGYIINNFYDADKDLINRPQKTLLDNYV